MRATAIQKGENPLTEGRTILILLKEVLAEDRGKKKKNFPQSLMVEKILPRNRKGKGRKSGQDERGNVRRPRGRAGKACSRVQRNREGRGKTIERKQGKKKVRRARNRSSPLIPPRGKETRGKGKERGGTYGIDVDTGKLFSGEEGSGVAAIGKMPD